MSDYMDFCGGCKRIFPGSSLIEGFCEGCWATELLERLAPRPLLRGHYPDCYTIACRCDEPDEDGVLRKVT